jgi:hypothetical protein
MKVRKARFYETTHDIIIAVVEGGTGLHAEIIDGPELQRSKAETHTLFIERAKASALIANSKFIVLS